MRWYVRGSLLAAALLTAATLQGAEIEGVHLPDRVEVAGQVLQLNGAGVRTKFFFDIYIGALYLMHKTGDARTAIEGAGPKRVTMDILYREVERQKLVGGWNAGFEKNQSSSAMQRLQSRLERFDAMFGDARRGDHFTFDFLADGTTHVAVNGKAKGVIEGGDFQQALLRVWLGGKPADASLKEAMLAGR